MANQFVPDQSKAFKKKMTLITDPASDRLLEKAKCKVCGEFTCICDEVK